MILVTVGGQMPFDRLVREVDDWCKSEPVHPDVFFQIGKAEYVPSTGRWVDYLKTSEFNELVKDSSAIVSHAGMGSILTALEAGKPILVLPRLGCLGETRNDHQVATANALRKIGGIHVAMDETELRCKLSRIRDIQPGVSISASASDTLLSTIAGFIHGTTD
ncbi:MAG: glycosyltransferase [Pseudomonadales bacterium]